MWKIRSYSVKANEFYFLPVFWLIAIVVFLYYTFFDEKYFSGTIIYGDGFKMHSSLISKNDTSFRLDSYFENEAEESTATTCFGDYIPEKLSVKFSLDGVEGHCLDSYELVKVESGCYYLTNNALDSRKQSFFFCRTE